VSGQLGACWEPGRGGPAGPGGGARGGLGGLLNGSTPSAELVALLRQGADGYDLTGQASS
jgi:hypothetical protein